MEQVHQLHDKYFEVADRALAKVPVAVQFQQKTGVPKVYGAAGIAFSLLSLVFFNIGAPLIVNLVGFGYAAYASMVAIESPGKEDDAQWLTYWSIFGIMNVIEYFTGFLLYWVPFYFTFKLGFLVWLMLPTTRGAEKLYYTSIRPIFLQKANLVDRTTNSAAAAVSAASSTASAAINSKPDTKTE